MLKGLCKVARDFTYLRNKYPKNVFTRTKTIYANAFSRKIQKKEPVEVVKWVLLFIPVTSFGLGCWQVYRLQWKLELIDILQSKSNSIPVPIPSELIHENVKKSSFSLLDNMEYLPVKVKGEFLHDKEMLIGPRALIENEYQKFGSLVSDPKKNQGWLVVTPFKLSDTGDIILINRGWVHQSMRPKDRREASMVKGEVELTGLVRLTEKRAPFMPKNNPAKGSWFSRDLEAMGASAGCAPVWLDARGLPDPPDGWPVPNQTRVTLRNEHFSYAVTWYMLSAFTGVMWHRFFIRKLPLI